VNCELKWGAYETKDKKNDVNYFWYVNFKAKSIFMMIKTDILKLIAFNLQSLPKVRKSFFLLINPNIFPWFPNIYLTGLQLAALFKKNLKPVQEYSFIQSLGPLHYS
jgi:hypothetical protein